MDYKQAVVNEDGELLGYDYVYDDGPDEWLTEEEYWDDDYADESDAQADASYQETDLDEEWL